MSTLKKTLFSLALVFAGVTLIAGTVSAAPSHHRHHHRHHHHPHP